jgi:hypothetical protein
VTDPEAKIRAALTGLLRKVRAQSPPPWVDEAVAEIRAAFGGQPSGLLTADGPDAARALFTLKERAERAEALNREVLDGFRQGGNGYSQRVSTATYEGWRERLGEQE